MTSDPDLLIVGASGSVGGRVADACARAGLVARHSMRATTRRSSAPGAVERPDSVFADLTEPESIRAAARGVRAVFLYTPRSKASEVAAALEVAEVETVVMLSSGSVALAAASSFPSAVLHQKAEAAFASRAFRFIPIRPLRLATDALNWAADIRDHGRVSLYRPGARSAPIHEDDVADVALHALVTSDERASATLTGPVLLTQGEQIAVIGAAIGRRIEIREQTTHEAIAALGRVGSRAAAEATVRFLDNAASGLSPVTDSVDVLLGRHARTFDEWAVTHAADFA